VAIELTVVSMHWRRWPSFIVQRVAENGAADVSYFTRRMWSRLHLAVHSGAVCYIVRCGVCPVVPFVTLGLAINPSLLWRHSYKIATLINLYVPLQRGHY